MLGVELKGNGTLLGSLLTGQKTLAEWKGFKGMLEAAFLLGMIIVKIEGN